MSLKVIRLSLPVYDPEISKERKVVQMPNLFTNLLNACRKKMDEIKHRKINILYRIAYRYYFDLFESKKIFKKQTGNEVDIPDFIYEITREKTAKEKASEAVMDIVKANRVGECFKLYKQNQRRGK